MCTITGSVFISPFLYIGRYLLLELFITFIMYFQIVNGIKKRPIMDFFSGDSAEWKNRKLFASAFIQISAVDGTCSTLVTSFLCLCGEEGGFWQMYT